LETQKKGQKSESQARYTAKVTNAGLKSDPYAIASECWVAEPEWSEGKQACMTLV